MQTTLKMTALAAGLFMASGYAYASDNPAQHEADCMIQKRVAEQIMEERLDGLTKDQAERGLDPDDTSKVNRWWMSITDKAYAYDISGDNPVDAFQEDVHQECMASG